MSSSSKPKGATASAHASSKNKSTNAWIPFQPSHGGVSLLLIFLKGRSATLSKKLTTNLEQHPFTLDRPDESDAADSTNQRLSKETLKSEILGTEVNWFCLSLDLR